MAELQEILHYTGYPHDRGGIVAVLRALQAAKRFRVIHGVGAGFRATGAPLETWAGPGTTSEQITLRDFWRTRTAARAVQAWLAENPHRIFHGHSRAGLLLALWLDYWGERRVVVTVHCYGTQRWLYRGAARRLGHRLFWLSPAMKKHYGLDDGTWAQCVPACAFPRPLGGDRPSPDAGGVVRWAGIGALVPWKNWHLVIEAFALLPLATRRRLRFRHIGAGDGSAESRAYAAHLRVRTAEAGLENSLEWLGEQPSSGPLLQESDGLLVPSINEPFSVAMLEALQAGVPVLAADSGGATDVVTDGRNGWLFRSGDAADLARKLAALADARALAVARVDPEALRRFSAAEVAEAYAGVYQRAVAP